MQWHGGEIPKAIEISAGIMVASRGKILLERQLTWLRSRMPSYSPHFFSMAELDAMSIGSAIGQAEGIRRDDIKAEHGASKGTDVHGARLQECDKR